MTNTRSRLSENLVWALEQSGGEPVNVKLDATTERGEISLGDYLRDNDFSGAPPKGGCLEYPLGEKFPKRIYNIGKEIKQYPDVEITTDD
jgi:hypothetical protein